MLGIFLWEKKKKQCWWISEGAFRPSRKVGMERFHQLWIAWLDMCGIWAQHSTWVGSLNLKPTIIREFLAEESPLDAFLPMHTAMPNASLVASR